MTTALCLFAGIGGTALGQLRLGHDVICVENNPVAVDTLRTALNPGQAIVIDGDVKALDFTKIQADVVLGGPPCQPFSQATEGAGEFDARDCIPDFVRAVRDTQPRLFVMEEVKTLTWQRHRPYLDRVLGLLRDCGYSVDYGVLDMSRYGVPQARKRLFVVGRRDGSVVWPAQSAGLTMAQALGWTQVDAEARAQIAPVYGDPSWVFTRPSTTVVGTFRPEVQAAPGYRTAGMGPRQNAPGSVVITVGEALTLQGLPADWPVQGTEAQKRLQIGNSCPPTMTQQITAANLA